MACGAMRDDLPVGAGRDLVGLLQSANLCEMVRRVAHPHRATKLFSEVWHASLHTYMMTPNVGAVETLRLFFGFVNLVLSCARLAKLVDAADLSSASL